MSLQSFALSIVVVPNVFAFLLVCLRFYRHGVQRRFGKDDIAIGIATQVARLSLHGTVNYVGVHFWDIPADYNVTLGMKWSYANPVVYNPILAVVKASVILSLLSLRSQNQHVNFTLWSLFILNATLLLAFFVIAIFQCQPIAFFYDHAIRHGRCINQIAFYVSMATITIVTDCMVLVIPTWMIHDLRLSLRKKVMVICVLSLDVTVTIVSIVRLILLIEIFILNTNDPDPSFNIGFCTSSLETNIAIIAACGPTIKWLVEPCLPCLPAVLEDSDSGLYGMHTEGEDSTYSWRRKDGRICSPDVKAPGIGVLRNSSRPGEGTLGMESGDIVLAESLEGESERTFSEATSDERQIVRFEELEQGTTATQGSTVECVEMEGICSTQKLEDVV